MEMKMSENFFERTIADGFEKQALAGYIEQLLLIHLFLDYSPVLRAVGK